MNKRIRIKKTLEKLCNKSMAISSISTPSESEEGFLLMEVFFGGLSFQEY